MGTPDPGMILGSNLPSYSRANKTIKYILQLSASTLTRVESDLYFCPSSVSSRSSTNYNLTRSYIW